MSRLLRLGRHVGCTRGIRQRISLRPRSRGHPGRVSCLQIFKRSRSDGRIRNFDVDISDPARYQEFMNGVKPALEKAGAKYLDRGGAHKVYEGDWEPRRIVLLEFPSVKAWEDFYNGASYQGLKHIRDACSSARLVSVAGL